MSQIDDIKRALDIVQVVSETVNLDTRSRTPKAVCPFHSERTPSFVVFPETGTWRCFGACATGGDVITFIQKRDNIEFRAALQKAAQMAGIELGAREPDRRDAQSPLVEANDVALGYFWTQLRSPGGEEARKYLEGRGIDIDTARRRDFGLAPSGMDTLSGHLKAAGVSGAAAAGAGLVVQTADGGWRDMFRGRLMIAIRDADGRVAGFGGRSLDGAEPKYLNTARTQIFDKSQLLYGLNWAGKAIRNSRVAVVVEGYMDVVTAHEQGFESVVASMGTAITAEQASLLMGMADSVVLALDSDAAGQEATFTSLQDMWSDVAGRRRGPGRGRLDVKVARLSSGKDPDELIRTSPNEWQAAIQDAAPLLEWFIDAYAARLDPAAPDGQARITEAVFPLIAAIDNPYEQDRYRTMLAERLGVSIEQLRSNAWRLLGGRRRSQSRMPARRRRGEAQPPSQAGGGQSLEEHLLALVFAYDDLREYADGLQEEAFEDPLNRNLFTVWKASATIEGLRDSITPDLEQRLDQIAGRSLPPADLPTRVADVSECVHRLHERRLRLLKSQEERVLQEFDSGSEPGETRNLVEENALTTNEQLKRLFARQR